MDFLKEHYFFFLIFSDQAMIQMLSKNVMFHQLQLKLQFHLKDLKLNEEFYLYDLLVRLNHIIDLLLPNFYSVGYFQTQS